MLLGVAVVIVVTALPAQATSASGWHLIFQRHYGATGNYSSYDAVAAPDGQDVWAFGATNGALPSQPVAVQYTGGKWQRATLPSGLGDSYLWAASASSASNVWAVSDGSKQYALEWDGTQWSVAHTWTDAGVEITGVSALSPTNVWVFGAPGGNPGIGTWHFDGTTWTQVGGAATGVLTVSALSSNNMWGIGTNGESPDNRVVHYLNGTWHLLSSPLFNRDVLSGVLALSASDVWVAGGSPFAHGPGILVNYNGKTWSTVTAPWKAQFGQIVSDGAGGLWFIAHPSASPNRVWLLHRSAAGTWTKVVPSPSSSHLIDLSLVGGTTTVVGTGEIPTADGSNAAIYQDGTLSG
jgi:hypothetical protein